MIKRDTIMGNANQYLVRFIHENLDILQDNEIEFEKMIFKIANKRKIEQTFSKNYLFETVSDKYLSKIGKYIVEG